MCPGAPPCILVFWSAAKLYAVKMSLCIKVCKRSILPKNIVKALVIAWLAFH